MLTHSAGLVNRSLPGRNFGYAVAKAYAGHRHRQRHGRDRDLRPRHHPRGSHRPGCADRGTPPARYAGRVKTVFDVGKVMTGWVPEFEWLFDLRDAAAHSLEVAETPVPHPAGTNTTPVHVSYSVESAERAVGFALSVLRWCVDHPRRRDPLAVKWSAEMRPLWRVWSDDGVRVAIQKSSQGCSES
jgi:hypothetical protein